MSERPAASKFGSASEGARPLTGQNEPVGAPDSHAAYVARLEAALQQIADDEYVPGPTTNQWLVERGQPEGETQAVWHSHTDPAVPWTTDAWRAS